MLGGDSGDIIGRDGQEVPWLFVDALAEFHLLDGRIGAVLMLSRGDDLSIDVPDQRQQLALPAEVARPSGGCVIGLDEDAGALVLEDALLLLGGLDLDDRHRVHLLVVVQLDLLVGPQRLVTVVLGGSARFLGILVDPILEGRIAQDGHSALALLHGGIVDGLAVDQLQLAEVQLRLLVVLFLLLGVRGNVMFLLVLQQQVLDLGLEGADLQVVGGEDVDGLQILQGAFQLVLLRICEGILSCRPGCASAGRGSDRDRAAAPR